MKNLNAYLEKKNAWGAIFGSRPLVLPQDAAFIRDSLNIDLSPENLMMDGEASMTHVRKQHRFLTAALKELDAVYLP
jgi:hypothetical protein